MNKFYFYRNKTDGFIKNIWLFACFLLFSLGANAQQCPTGDVVLYSQIDVNNFGTNYPNCTEITGYLYIDGSTITDLSPLSNIQSVGGYIHIGYNPQLTNLDGLSNLTEIGGDLNIFENYQLTNLDGLSNLTQIGGFLNIYNNYQLTNLDGLSNLTQIGEDLIIQNNTLLTDISGLQNIDPTTILSTNGLGLYIAGNPLLSVCNLDNFCTYLAGSGPRTISQNAGDCVSVTAVTTACTASSEPQCPTGNVTLTSQTDVNNFATNYPNCTEITGYLSISGSTIADLSPLSNIQSIGGYLYIYNNSQLTNIDGLSNLTQIGGYLNIQSNSQLTNLDGLSNLTQIGGYLNIESNSQLTNLDGLSNLTQIGWYLYIFNNSQLTNLDGLSNLTSIGADLVIYSNSALTDISGLQNIDPNSILSTDFGEGLYIAGNPLLSVCNLDNFCEYLAGSGARYIENNSSDCVSVAAITTACEASQEPACPTGDVTLISQADVNNFGTNYPNCTEITGYLFIGGGNITDLSPLNNIQSVGGYLDIYNNSQLTNLDGLSNLTQIGGFLMIESNFQLTNLDGLSNLTEIGGYLYIYNNSQLTNLDGLSNLTEIGGYLNIQNNAVLENLDGLSNLIQIGGDLDIFNNSQLTNLDGLSNLTEIGGYLNIQNNAVLENLDGLNALESINGFLLIHNNAVLTDISGLQNIAPAGILPINNYGLHITNNPLLSVCNLDNFCTYLAGSGPRIISNNAGDCISEQAVLNACEQSGNCNSYTIWNGTQWSNGEPDMTKRAIIEGDLTLTTNLTACKLLLNSGILTIALGATLTVNGVIENTQSEANFIVQSGGNLIQIEDVENIGEITVQRATTIKHLDYTIWSSPVLGQKLKAFSPYTVNSRIRIYDTTDDTWKVIPNPETTDFVSGSGVMFRAPNVFDDGNYPNAYSWTGNFKGIPQNGNVSYNFSNAYGVGAYQSVGNPYPSNITYSDLIATNPGIGTLYFWTNTNYENGVFTGNNWASYSNLGPVAADNSEVASNGVISVGQGLLVETDGLISEINFNNQMRTSISGTFFRTMTEEKHRLWLDLSANNQPLNQILVGYMDGATNSLDFGIDAKLFNYSGSALYSLIKNNQENYVIQGRSLPFVDSDVVPLGFRAVNNGSFTVSLSNFDGTFSEGQDIFIKDNLTSLTHNLKNGAYNFVSDQGIFDNRFEVVYREANMSISNPDLNMNWVVYKQDNAFQIQTIGFEMSEVMVYDMLGRVVYTSKAEGTNHNVSNINANQVLIVKVITTDNQTLNKKVSN